MDLQEILQRKKSKAFYPIVKRWLFGAEIEESLLAIELSSMLTHCLIEVNGAGDLSKRISIASLLEVDFQAKRLSEFICGHISEDTLREDYKQRFGGSFGVK